MNFQWDLKSGLAFILLSLISMIAIMVYDLYREKKNKVEKK